MTRSFGSHAKSEFDRTLSCGFEMPSDSVRCLSANTASAQYTAQSRLSSEALLQLLTITQ